jgi:hypothetical protein
MLASPQTITINAVPKTCNKISEDLKSSTYANDDGTVEFKVSHQVSKLRTRRMARLDQTVIAADPLTAENAYQKVGAYLVIDEPTFGFSTTEIDYLVQALTLWLTTANVTAMLAGRH